jgi:hypothetical protein
VTSVKDWFLTIAATDRAELFTLSIFELATTSPPILLVNEAPKTVLFTSSFGGVARRKESIPFLV